MSLSSPDWTIVMVVINVTSYIVIALVALWVRRAFVANGLLGVRVKKRLAMAFGFPVTEGDAPRVTAVAIRRFRFRLACLVLMFLGYLAGYEWLARTTNEATAEWLNGLRARRAEHRRTDVHRTSRVRGTPVDRDGGRP